MNKAEEIFRTFFATAEDLEKFKSQHTVRSWVDESWGAGACELHVANGNDERMVFQDKPSCIRVTPFGTWYATILWEYPNGWTHRDFGPAQINVDEMGGTLESYWRDDVEVSRHRSKTRAKKSKRYFYRMVLLD